MQFNFITWVAILGSIYIYKLRTLVQKRSRNASATASRSAGYATHGVVVVASTRQRRVVWGQASTACSRANSSAPPLLFAAARLNFDPLPGCPRASMQTQVHTCWYALTWQIHARTYWTISFTQTIENVRGASSKILTAGGWCMAGRRCFFPPCWKWTIAIDREIIIQNQPSKDWTGLSKDVRASKRIYKLREPGFDRMHG